MTEENPFLESFTISAGGNTIKFEELFALVSALRRDTTLKTLGCQIYAKSLYMNNDEVNQLVSIRTKNHGLEIVLRWQ
jgi:hypothetical protein